MATWFPILCESCDTEERERTRNQSGSAQKAVEEFGLITCETLPSTAAPQTVTRLGVGLGQSRRNEEERTQKQEGTTRGDVDIKRAMGDVLAFVLWLSISFGRQECD